ncbi:MAG: hypothetical protein ACK5MI_01370 [Mangrovibacterium sp.]
MPPLRIKLSYHNDGEIAIITILEDFNIDMVLSMIENFITDGSLRKNTQKIILIADNFNLLDSASDIMNSRRKWVSLLPEMHTAIVSNKPKVIASASIMEQTDKQMQCFAHFEEALNWLQQIKSSEIIYRHHLGTLIYNPHTQIATIILSQSIESKKMQIMWDEFLAHKVLPEDNKKFMLVQNGFPLLDSAQETLENKNEWATMFPDSHLAIISTDPKAIAVATLMNHQNKKTRVFPSQDEGLAWLNTIFVEKESTVIDKSSFFYKEDASKIRKNKISNELFYDKESEVATVNILRNIRLKNLNEMWQSFSKKSLIPDSTKKFIINQKHFDIIDSPQEMLSTESVWGKLYPDAYLAVNTSNVKAIAFYSILAQQNPRIKLVENTQKALEWVEQG